MSLIKLTKDLQEKKLKALNIISNVTSVRNKNLDIDLDRIIELFEQSSNKTNRIP